MWRSMIGAGLAAGGGPPPGDPTPHFTGVPVVTASSDGFCSGGRGATVTSSALLSIDWVLSPSYGTSYTASVYENSILVASGKTNTAFQKMLAGLAVNSGGYPANLSYRVDIIRTSDGVVVASATSLTWNRAYANTCG